MAKKENCHSDRRGSFRIDHREGPQEIESAAPSHVRAVRRLVVDQLTPEQLEVIGVAAEKVRAEIDGVGQAS